MFFATIHIEQEQEVRHAEWSSFSSTTQFVRYRCQEVSLFGAEWNQYNFHTSGLLLNSMELRIYSMLMIQLVVCTRHRLPPFWLVRCCSSTAICSFRMKHSASNAGNSRKGSVTDLPLLLVILCSMEERERGRVRGYPSPGHTKALLMYCHDYLAILDIYCTATLVGVALCFDFLYEEDKRAFTYSGRCTDHPNGKQPSK